MPVVPYRPNNLIKHRRPPPLLGRNGGESLSLGEGKDTVWEIRKTDLGVLIYYVEQGPAFTHGLVAPRSCMRYEQYKQALESTKPFWKLTDLAPFIQTPFISP